MKKVNGKYWSKKKQQWTYYHYEYDKTYTNKKGGRSYLVVGKGGRVTKQYEERIEQLKEGKTFAQRRDIDIFVKQAIKEGRKLSIKSLKAVIATTRIESTIINTGWTVDEVCNYLNVPREALLDEENWHKDEFTYNGRKFIFQFQKNYQGPIFMEVNGQAIA